MKRINNTVMKRFIGVLIFAFLVGTIFAEDFNRGRIKQLSYFEKIPYQKISGLPIVSVIINGKMYNFLFDTGAMLAISDRLYKELNLPLIGQTGINSASGETKAMRVITLPELHLQGITFENTKGIVLHEGFKWGECYGIDGIIGSNMLRNSVVHFDEQNKHIIITNNARKLSLREQKYQKIKFRDKQSTPYIIIASKTFGEIVIFDSVATKFFNLSVTYGVFDNKAIDILAESEGIFTADVHGMSPKQKHRLLNISELVVGTFSFNNVIATTTHAPNSRIGAKLLEYGTVTLNYKRKRFYFNPFDNVNTDDLSKKPMTFNFTVQNDKSVVGIIWDKALETEINVGDEVVSINGIDIQTWDFCQLYLLENIPDIEEPYVELRDINTGEIKKVELKRLQ